jgi:hypothetical protein
VSVVPFARPSGPGGPRPAPLTLIGQEVAATGKWPAADLALRFFPIYDFQRQRVTGLFCLPLCGAAGEALHGHRAFNDLSTEEWIALDCAILRHALAFSDRLAESGVVVAVGASVGFRTLSDPIGRMTYRDTLRITRAGERSALMIKIEDIPDTARGRRIGEIVSSVRTLSPRVWVHLPGSQVTFSGLAPLRAAGIVLSMPARLPMHGMTAEARWLTRTAAQQAALACMDHVDSFAELDIARASGIRFVAGQALKRPALAAGAALYEVRDTLYGSLQ